MTVLFQNGIIHAGEDGEEIFSHMTVSGGVITGLFPDRPEGKFARVVDLRGRHVYPCLIDAHVHLLLTVAVMAMGFSVCRITPEGISPNTMAGVGQRIREYAAGQKKNGIVACNNFILTGVRERRMPGKQELDDWGGGRPVVVYNIDGHSTALSSAMLELVGMDPRKSDGVLQGEENERVQGRLMDLVARRMTPALLAKGIANFQNACADYGISVVGALEGNGDSPKDATTGLIARLARHMDVGVRLYPQYRDLQRVKPFLKWMSVPRVGGCGDWEMDGSVGSHSAAMDLPYRDTGTGAECYFSQQQVDALVEQANRAGWQIASHAIGSRAIRRLTEALDQVTPNGLHRIEHCEFPDEQTAARLESGKYALVMQPGYSWIDKRYLHTYRDFLPEQVLSNMKLRSFYEKGVCLCGSSDSPVQELDPWLQMLGMVEFYVEPESLTVEQAFRCYTANAARAIREERLRGTLEVGKAADFFTAGEDLFSLPPERVVAFRPEQTFYGGKPFRRKKGTLGELLAMLLTKPKKI